MAKTDSQNLLMASKKVMELAEKRRARMSASAQPKAAVKAAPVKAEAPKAEVKAETVVKADRKKDAGYVGTMTIKDPEQAHLKDGPLCDIVKQPNGDFACYSVKDGNHLGTIAAKDAAKHSIKASVEAAAEVKAEKMPENGGFEASLEKTGAPDLGESEWGALVPPELAKAVEQAKKDDDKIAEYGIVIPKGLEDVVMAVTDPAALESDAEVRFDLVPFLPSEAQTTQEVLNAGAHWVVLANGEPLAKISLRDQDHADKIVAHFVSADFARSVVDGIQKHGIKATFAAVKAKTYIAKVDESKKIAEIKASLAASTEEALRQKTASLKAKYVENLGLVLEAAANNFIVENPLKDALVASLTNLGVPEAAAASITDEAFFQFGQKTLASFLDKAEEWSNTSPEAMKEIKAAMQSAGRRSRPLPSTLGAAHINPNYDQALANKMAASAVPVVPSESPAPVSASLRMGSPAPAGDDRRSALRAKIGRFSTY
jgi:hypothetical protein